VTIVDTTASVKLLNALPADWPGGFWWHWLLFTVVLIIFILAFMIGFVYLERRGVGRMQSRLGPNRTGPFGLFQIIADAIKVLLKEDIVPNNVDKVVHWLAPIVAFFPAMLIFAVVPFGDRAMLADLNIGILYIVAVSSISTVGVFMAGWGSSNKFSLLGAMRMIAAVVSYEIPLVLAIVGVVLVAGSLSMNQIVLAQDIPFILVQPLGFLIVFLAGCAEINRSPFDLLEADQEIVAGIHTEYSGMKFIMFYLVEYGEALALCSIITTLFLSGWKGPGLPPWLWFLIKVMAVFFFMFWIRATMPRVRIDQLMALAWKFLLPLALINLFITGIEILTLPAGFTWLMVIINIAVMVILVVLWSKLFKLGWGRVEV
jgi:NADH-quinone oxidoreductase subunit H